ncbi:MAG TPA: hypothetical protein VIV14_08535 [Gammaproteobacteria bacterium]
MLTTSRLGAARPAATGDSLRRLEDKSDLDLEPFGLKQVAAGDLIKTQGLETGDQLISAPEVEFEIEN